MDLVYLLLIIIQFISCDISKELSLPKKFMKKLFKYANENNITKITLNGQ